jgi:hypothetical protein
MAGAKLGSLAIGPGVEHPAKTKADDKAVRAMNRMAASYKLLLRKRSMPSTDEMALELIS